MAASDDHTIFVYRQGTGGATLPEVLSIEQALQEHHAHLTTKSATEARNCVRAGNLFCSHGHEMTYVICNARTSHFRHIGSAETHGNLSKNCQCLREHTGGESGDHLRAQNALIEHDYTRTISFTDFFHCKQHTRLAFEATSEVYAEKEVREVDENGRRFVTDVVYRSRTDHTIMCRIEVWRTHRTDSSSRAACHYLEVRCDHLLEALNRSNTTQISVRCETSTISLDRCELCKQEQEKQEKEAERCRIEEAERVRIKETERVRSEEAERCRIEEEERVRSEEAERCRIEEEERVRSEEAERVRIKEMEQERNRLLHVRLRQQQSEAEWAEKRATEAKWSESSMTHGFVVRVSATGAHAMTQAEIEQKRKERMSRESAKRLHQKRALKRRRNALDDKPQCTGGGVKPRTNA